MVQGFQNAQYACKKESVQNLTHIPHPQTLNGRYPKRIHQHFVTELSLNFFGWRES